MILRYYNALRWIYITRTRYDIVSRCFWQCRRVWRQDLISTRWRSSDITKRGWMVMQQDKIIRLFATARTALTGTASLHLVIVVSWWAHQALPRRSWQPFIWIRGTPSQPAELPTVIWFQRGSVDCRKTCDVTSSPGGVCWHLESPAMSCPSLFAEWHGTWVMWWQQVHVGFTRLVRVHCWHALCVLSIGVLLHFVVFRDQQAFKEAVFLDRSPFLLYAAYNCIVVYCVYSR